MVQIIYSDPIFTIHYRSVLGTSEYLSSFFSGFTHISHYSTTNSHKFCRIWSPHINLHYLPNMRCSTYFYKTIVTCLLYSLSCNYFQFLNSQECRHKPRSLGLCCHVTLWYDINISQDIQGPWRWRQWTPSKCQHPTTTIHGIITLKTLTLSLPWKPQTL